jgi:hypothetical protein
VSPRRRIDWRRAAACLAAALIQLSLISLLMSTRRPDTEPQSRGFAPITWFPYLTERARLPERGQPPARGQSPARPNRSDAAPVLVERAPPATIDWSKQATLAAERQVAAAMEAERRESAFEPRSRSSALELDTAPEPAPEFGWSHARTHRIERTPDGGTLLWLNDRCAIVLSALMPICSLGKPKANGALFEHMRDAPKLESSR